MNKIVFRPIKDTDFTIMHQRLKSPHIEGFYDGGNDSFDVYAEGMLERISNPYQFSYIFVVDGIDVGYIQCYDCYGLAEDVYGTLVEEGTRGVDMYIGEGSYMGKGIGSKVLGVFVDFVKETHGAYNVSIYPSPDNVRAIKSYKKAGFEPIKEFEIDGNNHLLMIFVGLKAIDAVLLLPQEIHNEIYAINDGMITDQQMITFGEQCHPHISLCMCLVSPKELSTITQGIEDIIKKYEPIDITYSHISGGSTFSGISLVPNKKLKELHEEIISLCDEYKGRSALPYMFHNPNEITEKTVFRAGKYFEISSGENFDPHITLGNGEITTSYETKQYTIGRIGICQLGNYCTARGVLKEWELQSGF